MLKIVTCCRRSFWRRIIADDVVELLSLILDVGSISVCNCLDFRNDMCCNHPLEDLEDSTAEIIIVYVWQNEPPFTLPVEWKVFY